MELDQARTGSALYLHQQARRVPLSEEEQAAAAPRPDRMAIGVEGGFQVEGRSYRLELDQVGGWVGVGCWGEGRCRRQAGRQTALGGTRRGGLAAERLQAFVHPLRNATQALVLMPARLRVPLPCPDLPEMVLSCIAAVQAHDSASKQVRRLDLRDGQVEGDAGARSSRLDRGRWSTLRPPCLPPAAPLPQEDVTAWEEQREVSKYALELEQLPAAKVVPMDPKQVGRRGGLARRRAQQRGSLIGVSPGGSRRARRRKLPAQAGS